MPEGVEVKLSANLIKPLVIGKTVADISVGSTSRYKHENPEGFDDFKESLLYDDVKVEEVNVKGKFMYWRFSNGWYLMNTFGMSGQWSFTAGDHPCFFLEFNDTTEAVFNDPRHFGTIKLTSNQEELIKKLNELGWDPLAAQMDDKRINKVINTLSRVKKPIAQVLMDQKVFAGVGNYIRAEALYLAKMSPWRQSNLLKKEEIITLCQAIVDVMNESYAHQGATILTYKDAYGAEGKYSSCFKVYGQKTDPLGNNIVKEETPEGRSIHWCPTVQT